MGILDIPGVSRTTADTAYANRGESAALLMSKLDAGKESTALLVLGDSTGDETNVQNRWVLRTAQWLAARYPAYTVRFRQWNIGTPNDLTQPGSWDAIGTGKSVTVQTGTGTGNSGGPFTLDVWNGSASGSSPAYNLLASRFYTMASTITPAADLVIINHGHNLSTQNGQGFRYNVIKLGRACAAAFPQAGIMITAQNPMIAGMGDSANDNLRARAAITVAGTEGYGLINIFQLYLNNASYGAQWISSADGLGLHPSDAGSIVWAQEVCRQLSSATTTVARAAHGKQDSVWVPANLFTAFTLGMSAAPTGGLVGDSGYMWGFPSGQLTSVVADVLLPTHWTAFDSFLVWCVASTTGKTTSTLVSWRLLRQAIIPSRQFPLDVGPQAIGAWVDPGVQSRNPSNQTAYSSVVSMIGQQSTLSDRVQAFRVQRNGNNGTDNIAETAYMRGMLFTQAT